MKLKTLVEENINKGLTIEAWKAKILNEVVNTGNGFHPLESAPFIKKRYRSDFHLLFRSRKHKTDSADWLFEEVSQLMNPNPNLYKIPQGRCNAQGESLLYCSMKPSATILEHQDLAPGDIFSIVMLRTNEIEHLSLVGFDTVSTTDQGFNDVFKGHQEGLNETQIETDSFISELFKKNESDAKEAYNLTCAISQILFHETKDSEEHEFGLESRVKGLIYPSIKSLEIQSPNVVFYPSRINQNHAISKFDLSPRRVVKIIIEDVSADQLITFRRTHIADLTIGQTIIYYKDSGKVGTLAASMKPSAEAKELSSDA